MQSNLDYIAAYFNGYGGLYNQLIISATDRVNELKVQVKLNHARCAQLKKLIKYHQQHGMLDQANADRRYYHSLRLGTSGALTTKELIDKLTEAKRFLNELQTVKYRLALKD